MSMSDQAESQRTRNCTRLLYIPTSTTAITTRITRKTMAIMNVSSTVWKVGSGNPIPKSYSKNNGDGSTERAQAQTAPLPLRSEVSLAGADLEVFLEAGNFDGPVTSIGVEVGRLIGNHVLASQFVFDGGERMRNVLHLEREEGAASGGFGNLFKHLVAAHHQATVICGNSVDNNFGALSHLNGLGPLKFALVVFAVAHDHDGLAYRMIGAILEEFLFAGTIDIVVKRGTSTTVQLANSRGEQLHLVRVVLRHLAMSVVANDERLVELVTER